MIADVQVTTREKLQLEEAKKGVESSNVNNFEKSLFPSPAKHFSFSNPFLSPLENSFPINIKRTEDLWTETLRKRTFQEGKLQIRRANELNST